MKSYSFFTGLDRRTRIVILCTVALVAFTKGSSGSSYIELADELNSIDYGSSFSQTVWNVLEKYDPREGIKTIRFPHSSKHCQEVRKYIAQCNKDTSGPNYTRFPENGRVMAVDMVLNPKILMTFKKAMTDFQKRGIPNSPSIGFHGTAPNNLRSICTNNFDVRRVGHNTGNSGYFGAGIYFGTKHVRFQENGSYLMCLVLEGNQKCGDLVIGGKLESAFQSYYGNTQDSKLMGLDELVIFENQQIIPLYLVHSKDGSVPAAVKPDFTVEVDESSDPFGETDSESVSDDYRDDDKVIASLNRTIPKSAESICDKFDNIDVMRKAMRSALAQPKNQHGPVKRSANTNMKQARLVLRLQNKKSPYPTNEIMGTVND